MVQFLYYKILRVSFFRDAVFLHYRYQYAVSSPWITLFINCFPWCSFIYLDAPFSSCWHSEFYTYQLFAHICMLVFLIHFLDVCSDYSDLSLEILVVVWELVDVGGSIGLCPASLIWRQTLPALVSQHTGPYSMQMNTCGMVGMSRKFIFSERCPIGNHPEGPLGSLFCSLNSLISWAWRFPDANHASLHRFPAHGFSSDLFKSYLFRSITH